MIYKFVINGKLPNLNDYLAAERIAMGSGKRFTTKGNVMKHNAQDAIIPQIRKWLKGVKINEPVILHYHFYEPNKKRDKDNVSAFASKVVQDSLVLSGYLTNDGWNQIDSFTCEFDVDALNPRIEVYIEEIQ